jgi:hypothetical protein
MGTISTINAFKEHDVKGRTCTIGVGVAACVFNILFSILLAVTIIGMFGSVAGIGSGFSTAGIIGLTVGPAAGIVWAIFAILQAVFVARANGVFVTAVGETPLKKLRGVHLGLNIATLAPVTGVLVLVSAPVTLVKLG